MKAEEAMRGYYAKRAPEYDQVYQAPERQSDLRSLEGWIPDLLKNKNIIEVASGTGYWTQFFAPVASRVVATDAAEETLNIARNRVKPGNIEFRTADAYALSEDLGQFDAAFAGFWLSHVPKSRLKPFLLNLHARLSPGSLVLLIDNVYVEGSSHPITERDAEGNTYQTRKLLDGTSHSVLKNFPTEEDLKQMIEGVGDRHQYRKLKYYWAFQYYTK